MSVIDLESYLEEISPDAPCGEDLEYDGEYGEMERATVGKDEQQFGDTVIPAEDPDWRDVKRKCLSLLKRTKDIRVAAHLARALAATDGLEGFSDAISLIQGYVEKYWDEHHPRLDPDDDNDPTFRVNTLVSLCDPDSTLRLVRQAPLVRSKMLGQFGLYHVDIAEGEISAPSDMDNPPSKAMIDAAFTDVESAEIQTTYDAVKLAIENVQTIEREVTEKVGVADAASLKPLVDTLAEAEKILAEQLRRKGAFDEPAEESAEATTGSGTGGGTAGGNAVSQAITGEITSRQDVIRTLDKICDYYERFEPSSPLPLLLRRAKRLATASFMEILQDLTPDGVAQAIAIGGKEKPPSEATAAAPAAAAPTAAAPAEASSDGW